MLRDCIRVIWHVLALALVVGFAMGFVLKGGTKTPYHSATNVARWLRENPDATPYDIREFVADQSRRIRFAFLPGELKFLRAGGRLTNAAFLGATLLRIKPTIEMVDGRLVATKKRTGSIRKCMTELCEHFCTREPMDLSRVCFTYTSGDEPDERVRQACEKVVRHHGAQEIEWMKSGCVS